MSQAREFVEQVKRKDPPDERMWRQFRFGDGSIAEYHPDGWNGEVPDGAPIAAGVPGDIWIVVSD